LRHLPPQRAPGDARRRVRPRHRRRLRLDRDPHRRPRDGGRNDLRPQLHRPRDRRHDRHRDLLDDRRRKRRPRRAAGRRRNLPCVRRRGDARERRESGLACGSPRCTPLRGETAAQPSGDASSLSQTRQPRRHSRWRAIPRANMRSGSLAEDHHNGMTTQQAVAHGIRSTAGVVTSAAIVMVAVFSIFITLGFLDFKMMGVGLAVAILLDATVVRVVLLPATMSLLGDWNWYLPRWLEWLPKLSAETPLEA